MNQIKPKITVITVCKNSDRTIEQTIQSVITQNYSDLEYIVVDGRSTDKTVDIIHKYEKYISCWSSESDTGIYDAMNKGIKMATGDYVAFLNSDDWYNEGAIQYVAEDIMKYGADVSSFSMNVYDGDEQLEWGDAFSKDIKNIRIAMCRCHQAIFARRVLFEKYGAFNVKYKVSADYDWLLRLYDNGVDIRYDSYAIVNYRLGGVSDYRDIEMRREAQAIATLALNRLREERKIREKEYCFWQDKIVNHYNKARTDSAMKRLIEEPKAPKDVEMVKNNLEKEVLRENRYSIFGCGNFGVECFRLLRLLGYQADCFWDNDQKKWGTFWEGIVVRPPYEIEKGKSKIIISTEKYFEEIGKQMQKMGLEDKIDYLDYNIIRKRIGEIMETAMMSDEYDE